MIHLPVLNRTYSAARGLGCVCNGAAVSVSRDAEPETSIIATGDIAQFISAGCEETFRQLAGACPYLRGYTDCFGHTLVLNGSVGAMIDPALNPWDAVATQVLVEEAGARSSLVRPARSTNATSCSEPRNWSNDWCPYCASSFFRSGSGSATQLACSSTSPIPSYKEGKRGRMAVFFLPFVRGGKGGVEPRIQKNCSCRILCGLERPRARSAMRHVPDFDPDGAATHVKRKPLGPSPTSLSGSSLYEG